MCKRNLDRSCTLLPQRMIIGHKTIEKWSKIDANISPKIFITNCYKNMLLWVLILRNIDLHQYPWLLQPFLWWCQARLSRAASRGNTQKRCIISVLMFVPHRFKVKSPAFWNTDTTAAVIRRDRLKLSF